MKRLLLAILLALLPVVAIPSPPAVLVLVFVEVTGGPAWADADRAESLADADAALDWLRARGLDAPASVADGGSLYTARVDSWQWVPEPTGQLTLYLVANRNIPLGLGPNGSYAGAYLNRGRMVLLSETVFPRPVAMAHELAHAVLGFPDWPTPPCHTDILCDPISAYDLGTLGCTTLAAMGTPCTSVYLPEVGQ